MLAFIVALEIEAQPFLNKVKKEEFTIAGKKAYKFQLNGEPSVLAFTGIGKVSNALTTQAIIDQFNPNLVINFGTCGALDNALHLLSYYLCDKACQFDFDVTELDDVPVGYIQEYKRIFFEPTKFKSKLKYATLGSADVFTSKEEAINKIKSMGIQIRDMEGGAFAQVCVSNNVPFIMIKGISDVHESNEDANQYYENRSKVANGFYDIINQTLSEYFDSIK